MPSNPPPPSADKEPKPRKPGSTLRYLDIGWRMLGIVLAGAGLGWFLDSRFPKMAPWGLLSLSMLGVVGSMYMIIREVSKKK